MDGKLLSNGQNGVAREDGKVLNERKNKGWRGNGWMEIVTEH